MRFGIVLLLLVPAAAACGGSKSTDRRDSAVTAGDSAVTAGDTAVTAGDTAVTGGDTAVTGGDTAVTRGDTAVTRTDAAPNDVARTDATISDGPPTDTGADAGIPARDSAQEAGGDSLVSPMDGATAAFCAGDLPRSVVNGITGAPVVRATRIILNCCDGFALELYSATFASAIHVSLIVSAADPFVPATIDLANLPQGWNFVVTTGCDSTGSGCKEKFSTGFSGTLQLSRMDAGANIDVDLCLHVEDTDGSHTLLRTLDLNLPHVVVP